MCRPHPLRLDNITHSCGALLPAKPQREGVTLAARVALAARVTAILSQWDVVVLVVVLWCAHIAVQNEEFLLLLLLLLVWRRLLQAGRLFSFVSRVSG